MVLVQVQKLETGTRYELEIQKVLGDNSYVWRSYRGETGRGAFCPLAPILNRVKLKKTKLLSNIKILTEKVHCIKNSHSSEDLIDPVNSSVLEVLTDVDRHLTENIIYL